MKSILVTAIAILGLYWLFAHYAPLPLNHEQFGLYDHTIHRIAGVILLVIAGLIFWLWHPKKS
jgi:hypothetical protein